MTLIWPRRRGIDDRVSPADVIWTVLPLAGVGLALAEARRGPVGVILDNQALMRWTGRLALVLWAAVAGALLSRRRRRQVDNQLALYLLFVWGVSVLAWSRVALASLDRDLDARASSPVTARVESKWERPRGVKLRSVTLSLPDGELVEVRVDADAYERAAAGKTAALVVKPGFFGWRWVADARFQ